MLILIHEREGETETDRNREREGETETDRLGFIGILWVKAKMLLYLLRCIRQHPLQESTSLCWYPNAEAEDPCYRYLASAIVPCFINTGSYKWFQCYQVQRCSRVHHGFALFIQYYLQEPLTLLCVFLIPSNGFVVSFYSILPPFSVADTKTSPLTKINATGNILIHDGSQTGLKTVVDTGEEVY